MGRGPHHRGAAGDTATFAPAFVDGRLAGFEKDMRICLAPNRIPGTPGITHAYFPALGACCAFIEYLTGLRHGNLRGIGWPQVADWAADFMRQPDYNRDTTRVLFEAFRHPVAHRGIASGVWVDRHQGLGNSRRMTWKVKADARYPGCEIVHEAGALTRDPPWACTYTHRVHIHLRRLWIDILNAANRYKAQVARDPELQTHFDRCMRQLYPG